MLSILIKFSNVIRTQLKYGVDDLLVTDSKSFFKKKLHDWKGMVLPKREV